MSDIRAWLATVGLQRYAPAFEAAEIDVATVASLTDHDLKELGLALGPRRRVLSNPPAAGWTPSVEDAFATARSERRHLTVMFVDLVDSTGLSARLDPEDWSRLLLAYKHLLAGEVVRSGGTLAKYLGDGALAYFGWPKAKEDAAECAIRCAFDILERVGRLGAEGGEPLRCRIGIATGPVVIGGVIGVGAARKDSVAGEVLNLAARLQALAEPDSLLVAQSTHALIGRRFESQDLGEHRVRGLERPVRVWRPLREAAHATRFAAARTIRTSFLGREREGEHLAEGWREASQGAGGAVLILGEAGMGKSRLAQELRNGMDGAQHAFMSWQCSAFHQTNALHPVIEGLAGAAGIVDKDPPGDRLNKLARLLDEAGMPRTALPLFADLLSLPPPPDDPPSDLLPSQRRAATIAALSEWVRRTAEARPLLLLIEDAHWIDATTLELTTHIVAAIRSAPMLAVVTGRPEFSAPWGGRPQVTTLVLDRLSEPQSTRLVREIAASAQVGEATVATIVSRSDGNPLFLEELSTAVLGVASSEPDAVPDSLQGSLMARLDQLGDARLTAQICAVLGRRFARPLLAEVAEVGPALLDMNLAVLVAHDVIRPLGRTNDGRYEFKHALLRDAAYESLLHSDRRRLHARCGRRLESGFPEVARTEPELLAHHFRQARLHEEARGYLEKAGDRAADACAFAEAIVSYRDAVVENGRAAAGDAQRRREPELLLKLGPALSIMNGAQDPEVRDIYRRAEEISRSLNDADALFKAKWGLWYNANIGRDLHAASRLAQELVDLSGTSGDEGHVLEALHCRWSSALFRGETAAAISDAARGASLYASDRHHRLCHTFGGHDPGVCASAVQGCALVLSGRVEDGLASVDRAISLGETLAHPHSMAHGLMNRLTAATIARDYARVTGDGRRLSALADRYNFPPHSAASRFLLGWAESQTGDPRSGLAHMRASFESATALGPMTLFYVVLFTDRLLAAGLADEALDLAERWAERLRFQELGLCLPELHRLRGEGLRACGRPVEAVAAFDWALHIAQRQGAGLLALRAAASRHRLVRASGDERSDESRRALEAAVAAMTSVPSRPDLSEARALLGGAG